MSHEEATAAEIASEQAYVDRAYSYLEAMRNSAQRIAAGYTEVGRGGTHQARLERDVAESVTRRRLLSLDIGSSPLCFGRIDIPNDAYDTDRYYIGHLGVTDDDQNTLIVDWRAPVAEPFYRATAPEPMGVVRRRHFQVRNRQILGIDDEVFNQDAVADAGFTVVGEAALLAALDRERTGRMGDIVPTIQAEQDEAIRASLHGALVVAGGPGTGKTAVALHRAAFLLYTHRQILGIQGVLFVGPSRVFLHYVDEVLPSLGEDDVQLATVQTLKPQLRIVREEADEVVSLKGDLRMSTVIHNAMQDRERGLRKDTWLNVDGHEIVLRARRTQKIVERVKNRHGTHNERRPMVVRATVDHLVSLYKRSLEEARQQDDNVAAPSPGNGGTSADTDEEWEENLANRLRSLPTIKEVLQRMWPVLTGTELVHDLFAWPALLHSASSGLLNASEQQLLERENVDSIKDVDWSEADVALIDEADSLLGPPDLARVKKRNRRNLANQTVAAATSVMDQLGLHGFLTATDVARRYMGDLAERDNDWEPRTFRHAVVDEAQDLTAMQWRMIARRCPSGSMTLVGDFGQASRPGALASWEEVFALLPSADHHIVELSVNYRTPAEIMQLANKLLPAAAPGVEPTMALRHTGSNPQVEKIEPGDIAKRLVEETLGARERGGTVAIVAPVDRHGEFAQVLGSAGIIVDLANPIDQPVALLSAMDVKGLEFDHVVLVEPSELVPPGARGLRLLYVAMTRATQTLTILHSHALPAALSFTS